MNARRNREIERWLAAEVAGDDVRAEAALVAAFAALPRLAPAPDFVERVLAAAPIRVRRAAPALWEWRWAIGIAVALTGLATWLLPALRWLPFEAPRLSDVVKAAAATTGAFATWLQNAIAVWGFLFRVGRLVAVTIQAPEIAGALAGTALVGAAALYTLNHLLALERRTW